MTETCGGIAHVQSLVGDGLVTQVPALIVSTAAGLLVSKAGIAGAADKALFRQLSNYPKALGMAGGVMLIGSAAYFTYQAWSVWRGSMTGM